VVFRRLLGAAFDDLHGPLRAVHEGAAVRAFEGHCEVVRGERVLSRCLAAFASLPPASERTPIRVVIRASGDAEEWRRDFGGHVFRSTLRAVGSELHERIGPATFRYRLTASPGEIRWNLVAFKALGIALPASLWPLIRAHESLDAEGRYRFDVRSEVPIAGLLVHYRGTLVPAAT
jgi:hypothetical protein